MLRAVRIPDPERRFGAYPHELSGGMAQRVAIAIALVCSPKLVISDDATSGLDVTVQAQVLDLLQRLVGEKGASALFITRDIAITAHFCSRIAIIYAGEIVELAETVGLLRTSSAPLQHHAARRLLAQPGIARALDPPPGRRARRFPLAAAPSRHGACAGRSAALTRRQSFASLAAAIMCAATSRSR